MSHARGNTRTYSLPIGKRRAWAASSPPSIAAPVCWARTVHPLFRKADAGNVCLRQFVDQANGPRKSLPSICWGFGRKLCLPVLILDTAISLSTSIDRSGRLITQGGVSHQFHS